MKKYILTLFILAVCADLSAQSAMGFLTGPDGQKNVMIIMDDKVYPCDTLDNIMMRVNYSYAFVRDTVSRYQEKGTGTLEIGKNFTKYYDGELFRIDSLARYGLVRSYVTAISGSTVNQLTLMETFIHDLGSGGWTCTGRVVTQDFKFKDDTGEMVWDILDSTSTVAGYNAVMARCSFRGRDYEAWFTPDIPASAGPWKFSGLPGLILSVKDTDGYFDFNVDKIYTAAGSIYLTDYLYLDTKREKYIEAKRLFETRPAVAKQRYWVNSDIEFEPSRKALKIVRTLGNDYIEKDM